MGSNNFLFEKTNLNSNLKSEWCLDMILTVEQVILNSRYEFKWNWVTPCIIYIQTNCSSVWNVHEFRLARLVTLGMYWVLVLDSSHLGSKQINSTELYKTWPSWTSIKKEKKKHTNKQTCMTLISFAIIYRN